MLDTGGMLFYISNELFCFGYISDTFMEYSVLWWGGIKTPLTGMAISELRFHSRFDFLLHREERLCYTGKIINGSENGSHYHYAWGFHYRDAVSRQRPLRIMAQQRIPERVHRVLPQERKKKPKLKRMLVNL